MTNTPQLLTFQIGSYPILIPIPAWQKEKAQGATWATRKNKSCA